MPSGGNKKSPGSAKGKHHQQSSKASSSKAPASTGNEAANTSSTNQTQTGDEDQNSGFADYLRSSQGAEMLKLFVVANSIVMFLTVAWPQMKKSYELLMSWFGGEEEEEFQEQSLISETEENMLLLAFRSFFFVAVIIGYSAGVWRLINDYFRREFKTFIDEEAKKNKYLLEDPVRGEVPPVVVGEHNPDQPAKPVTSNQMLDELILNFGRLFTTSNEQELPSKRQQTHQTSTIPNEFSHPVAGGTKSKPQGQQIESSQTSPAPPPLPTEPPDDPLGGAKPKTIIESDEFPRSSTSTMIAAADSGLDDEEEWIRYWENRRQVGVWGSEEEEQQCQGSVIDSCELNLEQPVPGS